jgi:hypothetical protein
MSWTESEKLNEWILRAYENGKREEQERILEILEEQLTCSCGTPVSHAIRLIEGPLTECECDPCGNQDCNCQGNRCWFCKSQVD